MATGTGAKGGKYQKCNWQIQILDAESASETEDGKQAKESKQSQDAQQKEKLEQPKTKTEDPTNLSVGVTSSLAETSEDEEAKK